MKEKILYSLHFVWTCLVAFSFPLCFAWIFLDITGHAKGYAYDLGPEKDISIMLGFVELIIWLVLSLPSNSYVYIRTKKKGKRYLLIPAFVYLVLATLYVGIFCGGWHAYVREVFNL